MGATRTGSDAQGDTTLAVDTHLGAARPQLDEGTTIGRYAVLDRVGEGGMGVVYRAYDPRLRREVALKLLRGHAGEGASVAETRLVREAQAMAQLSHPNVLPVFDVETTDHGVCIAMEFVDGRTISQWIEQDSPTRPQILDAFRQAAEGLAAAHRAALTHRDFKPSNVLIDAAGRVRVMDFGVATFGREEIDLEIRARSEDGDAKVDTSVTAGGTADSLTRAGTVIGTLPYMAPEQQQGALADARADQFAFFVALFEALTGAKPFRAKGAQGQLDAKVQGRIAWPNTLPARLREILARGLSPKPEDRFPSMESVASELARDPLARRRRVLLGVAAIAAVVGVSALAARRPGAEAVCTGSDDELAPTWNEQRRAEVANAFEATALPQAPAAADGALARLDAYAERWVAAHHEACVATNVRRERSEAMLDLSMSCLERSREHLTALVDVFAAADREVIDRALSAAYSLPPLSRCADAEYLQARLKPPTDPELARSVAELRKELVDAQAHVDAGKPAHAKELADDVLRRAEQLEYEPLLAEAHLRLGSLRDGRGKPDAIEHLEAAYFFALTLGYDEVAAKASRALVFELSGAGRFDEAHAWAKHARALLERNPRLPDRSSFQTSLGSLASAEGHPRESVGHFRKALELLRQAGAPTLDQAEALANLGGMLGLVDVETAAATLADALAMMEAELGPHHPALTRVLNNIAIVDLERGEYDEALGMMERVATLEREAFGEHSASYAAMLHNLGAVHLERGDNEEAVASFSLALELRTDLLGATHRDVGVTLLGLAGALISTDRAAEAVPLLERALPIAAAAGEDSASLAEVRFALARALHATGTDLERTCELARLAEATYAAMGDPGEENRKRIAEFSSSLR